MANKIINKIVRKFGIFLIWPNSRTTSQPATKIDIFNCDPHVSTLCSVCNTCRRGRGQGVAGEVAQQVAQGPLGPLHVPGGGQDVTPCYYLHGQDVTPCYYLHGQDVTPRYYLHLYLIKLIYRVYMGIGHNLQYQYNIKL